MNKLRALMLAVLLSIGVSSCSTTDLIKGAGSALGITQEEPMIGIDTEVGDDTAQIGKTLNTSTNQNTNPEFDDVEGNVVVNTQNSASTSHQEKTVTKAEEVNFYDVSPFALFCMLFLSIFGSIGWLAPSAKDLWKMWKNREK